LKVLGDAAFECADQLTSIKNGAWAVLTVFDYDDAGRRRRGIPTGGSAASYTRRVLNRCGAVLELLRGLEISE